MRFRRLQITIIMLLLIFSSTAYGASVPQDVLDSSKSIVYIEVEVVDGLIGGSGFVIHHDTNGIYIATNNHVIEENLNSVYVWTDEGEKSAATVLVNSENNDLAIIRLPVSLKVDALKLSRDAKQGDEVFAVGFPAAADVLANSQSHSSNQATITNGIISSVRNTKNIDSGPNIKLLQINAEINPGNSGGPLLNSHGEVVGINTYGVLDAQGIFGAISSEELIAFIQTHGLFELKEMQPAWPSWIIFACICSAVIMLAACAVILSLKNKRCILKKTGAELALSEYLARVDTPLSAQSIVSLLMPLITKIRDRHMQGSVYLKLSPSRITVTKEGCKFHDSNDIPTDEFFAPEQRTGGFAGIKADVYGICAVIRYMVEFYYISNPIGEPQPDADKQALARIISRGFAENPEDRFASVQELIFELSPFNKGISDIELEPFISKSKKTKKEPGNYDNNIILETRMKPSFKKKQYLKYLLVSVFGTVLILIGFCALNYLAAMNHAKKYEFEEAYKNIRNMPFCQTMFFDEYRFIVAGVDMDRRNFDKAVSTLVLLGDYKCADQLLLEAKYRKAAVLANMNDFENAITIYLEIAHYKDSAELVKDTEFRKASYVLDLGKYSDSLIMLESLSAINYEPATRKIPEVYYLWGKDLAIKDNYIEAYNKLQLAGDFLDAKQIVSELTDLIYYTAIDFYRSRKFNSARNYFEAIGGDYLDSKTYILLINGHTKSFMVDYKNLERLIGFEDSSRLIMSNKSFAYQFLMGTWRGNSRYFTLSGTIESPNISHNIPWDVTRLSYVNYIDFENGLFYLHNVLTPNFEKYLFRITMIDMNCIEIFAYKNFESYILYRQL